MEMFLIGTDFFLLFYFQVAQDLCKTEPCLRVCDAEMYILRVIINA